jgi:hypothetical protein
MPFEGFHVEHREATKIRGKPMILAVVRDSYRPSERDGEAFTVNIGGFGEYGLPAGFK